MHTYCIKFFGFSRLLVRSRTKFVQTDSDIHRLTSTNSRWEFLLLIFLFIYLCFV